MISGNKLIPILCMTLALILLNATLGLAVEKPIVLTPDELGGNERYLAYTSTDKPVYREGESLYLRTVVLNAHDNTPFMESNDVINVKIVSPKGDVVHEEYSYGIDSSNGYQWTVPVGIPGGQYTAQISSDTLGFPVTERTFDIRTYRTPRLKTQLEFTRDGYGPGDVVRASASIERAEGGIPVNATVTAIARLDGKEIHRRNDLTISDTGVVDTSFKLPDVINSGEGSLAFVIADGGVVETASKTLPVVLQKMDITFYPESGDLIAGLQSRVYFQARLANGKPADVQGSIVELEGDAPGKQHIADLVSKHEGRGYFSMTPEKGKRYAALFTAPSGITHPVDLPEVKAKGTIIHSTQSAFAFDEPIEFSVESNASRPPALFTLYKRDRLLDSQPVKAPTLQLDAKDAEGVLIATAWDKNGYPLAERLIYRLPRFGLNVDFKLSEGPFVPGGKVSVDLLTTDDQGRPVEAIVGLTVTDDAVLELVEKRQQAPRLPSMVYLENEVLDLADAHVYLDRSDPNAAYSVDLLLGTQGWRRFVLVKYAKLKQQYPLLTEKTMAQNDIKPIPVFRNRNAMLNDIQLAVPMAAEMQMQANAEIEEDNITQLAEVAIERNRLADQTEGELAPAADLVMMDEELPARRAPWTPAVTGFVREFAFQARKDRKPNERSDFTETLYWNSGIKTNARDGTATVEFSLSDSVTTFRILADAYGRNGALGASDLLVNSVEPFYITAKMPQNAVAGDVIELPITMVNTSTKTIQNASLNLSGGGITSGDSAPVSLGPGQRIRRIITLETDKAGIFPITIIARAGPYSDTVTRTLNVGAAGFPETITAGGLLSSATPFETTVTIPNDIANGSVVTTATVYPSPLASMQGALNALLREPHGCFEQTSSTNYPLVMAQQYFDSHNGIDPAVSTRSRGLLKTGYGKLTSFESDGNGYEWFGATPAHEALTAYGLMQFTDMAKVMQVDGGMINRTRQWLLDRRDGEGGFKRNEQALDSFGRAPVATTNAYIVWALLESGQSAASLQTEIAWVKAWSSTSEDSYIHALAANILFLSGDTESAELLAMKLVRAVSDSGSVENAATSITGSGGDSLEIETTSLALLAWLRDDEQWAAQVETSIRWLFEKSKSGRFGSTQSTVLALKAINAYDAARTVPRQPGAVQLFIDNVAFGKPVTFTKETRQAISLPEFTDALTPGEHTIELRMVDGSKMPFALEISYHTTLPTNADILPIQLTTTLSNSRTVEGEPVELQATIAAADNSVSTPLAIIGIPAGLTPRHEQLKELVANGSISSYEVRQSELVLYWRALEANETRVIAVDLTADIPGTFKAPASRIYPYYTDEQKHWVAGHSVEVVAR